MKPRKDTSPRLLMLGFSALLILILGFGGWSITTTISGAVIAPGQIKTRIDEQVIQHPEGGVVAKIHVQDGDIVAAGDPILSLDGTLKMAELNSALIQEAEYRARAARLVAERNVDDEIAFPPYLITSPDPDIQEMIADQIDIFIARRAARQKEVTTLAQRKMQIDAQIQGALAQKSATEAQLEIIQSEVATQQSLLEKGLAQTSRLNELKRTEAGLQGSIGSLTSQVGEAREKITELQSEFDRTRLTEREDGSTELRQIRTELLGLAEQKITLEDSLKRLDIRAPIAGMIHGLKVHALQSVVSPAEELAQIVPVGRDVVVSAKVQPIHIDEIHIGQKASLRFSALNQRITPVIFGEVARISADAFQNPNTGESYYDVEIVPALGETDRLGEIALVPGMPVEGYISTGDRSPMSYLIKPFADYFAKAFRES